MRAEYDLTKLKGHRNPYAKALKRQVTIRLGTDIINYFKSMADKMGVPYRARPDGRPIVVRDDLLQKPVKARRAPGLDLAALDRMG